MYVYIHIHIYIYRLRTVRQLPKLSSSADETRSRSSMLGAAGPLPPAVSLPPPPSPPAVSLLLPPAPSPPAVSLLAASPPAVSLLPPSRLLGGGSFPFALEAIVERADTILSTALAVSVFPAPDSPLIKTTWEVRSNCNSVKAAEVNPEQRQRRSNIRKYVCMYVYIYIYLYIYLYI